MYGRGSLLTFGKMKTLLTLLLLLGAFITAESVIGSRAAVVAIWSDFKAFEARVAADDAGARILKYGGESDSQNFDQLLRSLWDLPLESRNKFPGILVMILAATGLIIEIKKKKPNPRA
jgi:hypothetical protein